MAGKNVNKVIVNGSTIFDLTGVTVTPETLAKGVTAHDKSGAQITGTAEAIEESTSTVYFPESYASEGYDSLSSTKYPTASSNCGYEAGGGSFVAKTSSNLVLCISGVGLLHGTYDDSDNKYEVVYSNGTWHKLLKFPKAAAPSAERKFLLICFGAYGTVTDSYLPSKIDSSGNVWFNPAEALHVNYSGTAVSGYAILEV